MAGQSHSGLRSLQFSGHYEGLGTQLANQLVIPALKASVHYDRLTSYFTAESLIACAAGIDDIWQRQGKMRLVLGIHAIPLELAAAASSADWVDRLVAQAKANLLAECAQLTDEVARNQIGALGLMLRGGFLSVRVAVPRSPTGLPSGGILHSKRYLFFDAQGDATVAIGSPNETASAHSQNYEELTVHSSWDDATRTAGLVQSFETIWGGQRPDLFVRELDPQFADALLSSLRLQSAPAPAALPNDLAPKVISLIRSSPEFAFANVAKAALFPHQERALRDAASRWPIRVLLADEVGLGKTIEAGSLLAYAKRFLGARRILVLTPAGLRQQWQSELLTHFGITAWRFESDSYTYVSPTGQERVADRSSPLTSAPDVVLVSWQLARGSWRNRDVFAKSSWKPDLILVDEAHSARRSRGLDKKLRTTLVWEMIQGLGLTCPHLVLLTATPMQIQIEEYHGLLMLLGLPKWWLEVDQFIELLSQVERFRSRNELSPTKLVAEGIAQGLTMLADPASGLRPGLGLSLTSIYPSPLAIAKALALMTQGDALKELAVAAAPPAFLTVRNTRRGLEALGYKFPERVFSAPALAMDTHGQQFLRRISSFLDDAYGRVELALGLSDKGASAFVKSIYYQRLVSSRASAQSTLDRRATRLHILVSSGLWEPVSASADEVDPDDSESEPTATVTDPDLEAAKQCARIELQYIEEMRTSLSSSSALVQDPKLAAVIDIVQTQLAAGDSILVFSRFTDTVDACIAALQPSLSAGSIGYGNYTGKASWVQLGATRTDVDKSGICRALKDCQVRVIFCSDAASEGLNLQSARCLINVDVPWNPARLEQRIGRVARLGQKAAQVAIYNLWYPGTIEEQMYSRLLSRQDLYALAVGDFPDVIGEAIRSQLKSHATPDFSAIENDLNELRSKAEMRSLQNIWSRSSPHASIGGQFREKLFTLLVDGASRLGLPVDLQDTCLKLSQGGLDCSVESRAGLMDSLTVHHPVMHLFVQPWLNSLPPAELARLFVLLLSGKPTALLVQGVTGFHVLGPLETLSALEAVTLGGIPLPTSGPLLSPNPSSAEVLAALRTAFPSRIEVGQILVPTTINLPLPVAGTPTIVPLTAWDNRATAV